MEDQGVLPFDLLNQIRDLIRKGVARIVQRPGYVSIVTPLIVPATPPHKPSISPQFIQPKSQSRRKYKLIENREKQIRKRKKIRLTTGHRQ